MQTSRFFATMLCAALTGCGGGGGSVAATRTISTNDLPDHGTGIFPIATTDPAYAYDQNPGSIAVNTLTYSVPQTPAT